MAIKTKTMDYIAKSRDEFEANAENFLGKIDSYAATLGLSEEQVTAIKSILQKDIEMRSKKIAAQFLSKSETKNDEINHGETIKAVREIRKLILGSGNCTPAILEDLGLLTTKKLIDIDTIAPELRISFSANIPKIRYKKGIMDGIRLYCTINGGEKSYEETVILPSYDDNKEKIDPTQPETREYYAFFFNKGKIVGQKSNTVKIVLEGNR